MRVDAGRLLEAPARITYRPGRIVVRVHADQLKPDLLGPIEQISETLIAPYDQQLTPEELPTLACRIHRVRRLPAGRLVAAEIVDSVAHVEVLGTMMTADLAAALEALGTNVGRHLTLPH